MANRYLEERDRQKEDYERLNTDANEMLEQIKKALKEREKEMYREININWGYNGSLGHINDELSTLLGMITEDDELQDGGYEEYKARK